MWHIGRTSQANPVPEHTYIVSFIYFHRLNISGFDTSMMTLRVRYRKSSGPSLNYSIQLDILVQIFAGRITSLPASKVSSKLQPPTTNYFFCIRAMTNLGPRLHSRTYFARRSRAQHSCIMMLYHFSRELLYVFWWWTRLVVRCLVRTLRS